MKNFPAKLISISLLFTSQLASSGAKPKATQATKSPEAATAKPPEPSKQDGSLTEEDNQVGDTKVVEKSQTNIDFSESLIEGKMRAPSGFFIQGRLSQDLTRMVRLRTTFKPEMMKATGLPDLPSKPAPKP
jgi:hypothetical protein